MSKPLMRPKFLYAALAITGTILGVGIVVPLYTTQIAGPTKNLTMSGMSITKTALSTFQVDCGRFPSTEEGLDALVHKPPGVSQWESPYLDKIPVNEWGHLLRYTFPDPSDPNSYDLRSAGPDGIFDTADDIKKFDL